jgi:hypothetical protein
MFNTHPSPNLAWRSRDKEAQGGHLSKLLFPKTLPNILALKISIIMAIFKHSQKY